MKTEQQIVEDSSLKLAVQLDDVRKQAQDLGAAIELNTDANVDVAKANETLVKALDQETNAIKRSTEYIDTTAYSKRNELDVNEKYQKALERRTELENKLNAQQPVIPYSETDPERFKPKQKPASEPSAPTTPAFNGTLDDYLKANLGSLNDFKKQLRDERKAKDRESSEGFGIAKIAKNAIQSTMSAGSNAISSIADTLLQGIPGAGMARSAVSGTTKFVKDKVVGGFESRKKTREQYESKKSELTSKFEKIPQAEPATLAVPSTEEKIRQNNENKNTNEERTERKEGGRERKENEKRHKSLLDALKNGQMMTMLGGLFSVLFTMFTGLLGSTRGILGGVLKLAPALIAMGAKLVSGMGAAIAGSLKRIMPDFMKGKLPGTKVPGVDPKTGKPSPEVDVDKKGKGKTTSTSTRTSTVSTSETSKIERVKEGVKGAKAAGGEVAESAGSKAASAGAKSVGKAAGKGAAVKVAAKVLGKTLLRFIPFVGTAMLAYDAYTIADELSGGKLTESLMSLKDKAVAGASEAMGMSAGADPVSDEVSVHEKNLGQAEKQAEAKKTQEARATAAYQSNSVNTTNNKTYTASGFAFGSDSMLQLQPYGVQSPR